MEHMISSSGSKVGSSIGTVLFGQKSNILLSLSLKHPSVLLIHLKVVVEFIKLQFIIPVVIESFVAIHATKDASESCGAEEERIRMWLGLIGDYIPTNSFIHWQLARVSTSFDSFLPSVLLWLVIIGVGVTVVVVVVEAVIFPSILRGNPPMKASRSFSVLVLSKEDLKGTRIEHGFKRAFMLLFVQDDETFTSTMFLNVDQLQKPLDKDKFQEDGSMAAFGKAVGQNQNDTDANHADIIPIYDEEPMVEIQFTAKCNVFAIGQ
ncbi:hypothetical protein Tco_0811731 [Tanacetum coccineum]